MRLLSSYRGWYGLTMAAKLHPLNHNIMALKRTLSNEQLLRKMIKELDTVSIALVTERLITTLEGSIKAIEEDHEGWNNGFIYPDLMKSSYQKALDILKSND